MPSLRPLIRRITSATAVSICYCAVSGCATQSVTTQPPSNRVAPEVVEPPAIATTRPAVNWSIERAGQSSVITWPSGRTLTLTGAFRTDEGRILQRSLQGDVMVAAYDDGRVYRFGRCIAAPIGLPGQQLTRFLKQHDHPATVAIIGESGLIDRISRGDANNDGYNETTGSYQINSNGSSRVTLSITPDTNHPTMFPILEITDLPTGDVQATAEGQWLSPTRATRNGVVLLVMPLVIERPIVVTIKVVDATQTVKVSEE